MEYTNFQKCIDLIKFWRSRTGVPDHIWADSRDPELQPIFAELGVVPQDLEKSLVALAAYRSAQDGVYQSISSIVHLIRNRESKGMFRTHLTDSNQFPRMAAEGNYFLKEYPSKEQEFEKVLGNLDEILQSKTVDITQGAIYFGILGEDMDEWFSGIVHSLDNERTIGLGNMAFFKQKEKK